MRQLSDATCEGKPTRTTLPGRVREDDVVEIHLARLRGPFAAWCGFAREREVPRDNAAIRCCSVDCALEVNHVACRARVSIQHT